MRPAFETVTLINPFEIPADRVGACTARWCPTRSFR